MRIERYVEAPLGESSGAYIPIAAGQSLEVRYFPTIQSWNGDDNTWFWQTIIAPFFKPLAYSLILLRSQGQPCIFYGDLYGINARLSPSLGHHATEYFPYSHVPESYMHTANNETISIDGTALVSKLSRRSLIVLTRIQDLCATATMNTRSALLAFLATVAHPTSACWLTTDMPGELWTDILGWRHEAVLINKCGYGVYPVAATSVSIWVNSRADGSNAN
jgi:alpha-amylase